MTIERVRKRIREYALNERTAGGDAIDAANRVAATWLVALTKKPDTDPVVRVNAMLLLGELRAKDGRPWPEAAPMLAVAMADPTVAPAVRVAAASGLARHIESARALSTVDPALAQEAGKRLLSVITTPASDRVAGEWLVARAIDMLPVVVPKAGPDVATALTRVLNDGGRPIDVRVRAAAALGASATADSRVDAARVVTSIRGLAIAGLKADRDAAAERSFDREIAGAATPDAQPAFASEFPGGRPGLPGAPADAALPAVKPLVVRRDAWRLATLATAIKPNDGDRGIVSLIAADAKPAAEELAKTLRAVAGRLDASPDAASLTEAIETLERAATAAPAAAASPTGSGAPGGKPPASDPFSAPTN
jgi:hypothetical protein